MKPIFTNQKGPTMTGRAMQPRLFTRRNSGPWSLLEEDSHLLDVQDMIREAIRRGEIRVLPGEGGRIRILPTAGPDRSRTPHSG